MRKHLASRVSLLILKGFFWEGVKRRRRRMEGWRMEGKDMEKQGSRERGRGIGPLSFAHHICGSPLSAPVSILRDSFKERKKKGIQGGNN